MREYEIGDKVKYRPNPKVEPWICEVIELPPVKVGRGKMLERYKVRTLAPENIAGDEVNLKPSQLSPADNIDRRDEQ